MTISKKIIDYIAADNILAVDITGIEASNELRLAVAILLIRAACGDERFAPEEREEILRGLSAEFAMERRDVESLIEEARELNKFDSWISSYLEEINKHFDVDQRIEILSLVWRVAESDNFIDATEDNFLDSVQQGLNLSEEERKEAERRAQV